MGVLDGTVAGPTVALHARRGRGGNQKGRGPGVRLGAAGAPKATVQIITPDVMVGVGILIPNGMVKTIIEMMEINAAISSATTVAGAVVVALGPDATAKTGTTVPIRGRGPRPGTTVPGGGGKTSTRVLRARPSYSALGGRGG